MRSRTRSLLRLWWLAGCLATLSCVSTHPHEPVARVHNGVAPGAAGTPTPPVPVPPPAPTPVQASISTAAAPLPEPIALPSPPPAAPPSPPAEDSCGRIRELHRLAAERYAAIDAYTVQVCRREQIRGEDKPEEVLLFKFRKQPYSVYLKWLGPTAKGREAVFVEGRHQSEIHTLLAAGDIPFCPEGKQISLAPDSPFVRSSSRHAITEAGIGVLIDHFGKLVAQREKEQAQPTPHTTCAVYQGLVKRAEYEVPLEMVEQVIAAGAEPQLPTGGRRLWGFDPASHLPLLIVTQDATGHEVEYYCHTAFQPQVSLSDDDFDPDKLWRPRR